jgi:hypothetical protein
VGSASVAASGLTDLDSMPLDVVAKNGAVLIGFRAADLAALPIPLPSDAILAQDTLRFAAECEPALPQPSWSVRTGPLSASFDPLAAGALTATWLTTSCPSLDPIAAVAECAACAVGTSASGCAVQLDLSACGGKSETLHFEPDGRVCVPQGSDCTVVGAPERLANGSTRSKLSCALQTPACPVEVHTGFAAPSVDVVSAPIPGGNTCSTVAPADCFYDLAVLQNSGVADRIVVSGTGQDGWNRLWMFDPKNLASVKSTTVTFAPLWITIRDPARPDTFIGVEWPSLVAHRIDSGGQVLETRDWTSPRGIMYFAASPMPDGHRLAFLSGSPSLSDIIVVDGLAITSTVSLGAQAASSFLPTPSGFAVSVVPSNAFGDVELIDTVHGGQPLVIDPMATGAYLGPILPTPTASHVAVVFSGTSSGLLEIAGSVVGRSARPFRAGLISTAAPWPANPDLLVVALLNPPTIAFFDLEAWTFLPGEVHLDGIAVSSHVERIISDEAGGALLLIGEQPVLLRMTPRKM